MTLKIIYLHSVFGLKSMGKNLPRNCNSLDESFEPVEFVVAAAAVVAAEQPQQLLQALHAVAVVGSLLMSVPVVVVAVVVAVGDCDSDSMGSILEKLQL